MLKLIYIINKRSVPLMTVILKLALGPLFMECSISNMQLK